MTAMSIRKWNEIWASLAQSFERRLSLQRRWLAALAFLLLPPQAATADTLTLTPRISVQISGIAVEFPIALALNSQNGDNTVSFKAQVDLADVIAKIDDVVRSASLDNVSHPDVQSFNYNGTLMTVAGERLHAKYHFRVDVKNAKPTDGSVALFLRPIAENDTVRFVVENVDLNISNDIARAILRAFDLDRKIETLISDEADAALSSPEGRLRLPDELASANLKIATTRFETNDGRNLLTVEGTLQLSAELLGKLVLRYSAAN